MIFLAGALVSRLLWTAGRHQGMPVRELRRTLAMVWTALVACAVGLVMVRLCLSGGVIDHDSSAGSQLVTRRLPPGEMLLLGAGLVWMGLWLMVALRAARRVTERLTVLATDESEEQS